MKFNGNPLCSALIVLSALSSSAACSDALDMASEEQVESATDELAEISELAQALNSNTNCGAASADKLYTSIISPSFTSPSNYAAGGNGCDKAYFVRVSSYRTGNTSKANIFEFAGPEPATAAACRDTRLMVYAFQRSGSTVEFIDNVSRNGTPELDTSGVYIGCVLPRFSPDGEISGTPAPFPLVTGRTYQFAVSARTNNSGNPTMQPIRMTSRDRQAPPG